MTDSRLRCALDVYEDRDDHSIVCCTGNRWGVYMRSSARANAELAMDAIADVELLDRDDPREDDEIAPSPVEARRRCLSDAAPRVVFAVQRPRCA